MVRAFDDLTRKNMLEALGCPTANRMSAVRIGRLAFAAGFAGVSWAAGAVLEAHPADVSQRDFGDVSPAVGAWLVHHGGPVALMLVPFIVAGLVFSARAPARRLLVAVVVAPLTVLAAHVVVLHLLNWHWVPAAAEISFAWSQPQWSLGQEIAAALGPALACAALALVPLLPILWLARSGEADDHDLRARSRIGWCLAVASVIQLLFVLRYIASWPEIGFVGALAPLFALAFGILEIVTSRRLLAQLPRWVARVRKGEIPGVRIRESEPADSALYIPDLTTPIMFDDLDVIEAYADSADAGPYRGKRAAVPLRHIPRV